MFAIFFCHRKILERGDTHTHTHTHFLYKKNLCIYSNAAIIFIKRKNKEEEEEEESFARIQHMGQAIQTIFNDYYSNKYGV